MIGKNVRIYCCEDLSLIENYDKALNDNTQIWECHHRLEVREDGTHVSAKELEEQGLFYNRPACELIFLTPTEHIKLHKIGNTNMLGKYHSEDAKKKIGQAKIGNTNMLGKHHSEDTKKKMSIARKKYWEDKKKKMREDKIVNK